MDNFYTGGMSGSRWIFSKLVAHRGGGKLAPENTLTAIEKGLSLGYRAVEFDVMLTRDKIPVLMHDEHTGRTIQLPDGRQQVALNDLSFADIAGLDAGSWLHDTYAHARVPLFADVLAFCHQHDIWMNIEIKPCPGHEQETGDVVASATAAFFAQLPGGCHALPAEKCPLLSSFSVDALRAAKNKAPHLKRGLLIDVLADTPQWREQCRELEVFALHVDHHDVTAELVAEVRSMGLGLFCYTVNDVARAKELLDLGVDSFCTDVLLDFQPML
jgi:glycerophosphoryl diester phosphodiesterase